MSTTKLEVFISYARADASAFVGDLATGLEVADIQPFVDMQSISAAEEWKPRISALIQQADTVIFVITPAAVKSEVFKWEIEEAIARSKRLVPIQWLETPIADLPPELAKLNLIFFSGNRSFVKSLKVLVETLESDLQWVREHTRLGERALEWDTQYARDDNALLVGKQLVDAETWLVHRPANAPPPTALQLDFIAASRRLAVARDSAERKRLAEIEASQAERARMLGRLSRRTRQGLIGLGALALVIIAIAGFAWQQKQAIDQQKQAIDEASLRLRGIVLKIAETDRPVRASDKWYRIATDYKLSTAILGKRGSDPKITGVASGFLMRARALNPAWGEELVLLTAAHALKGGGSRPSDAEIAEFSAVFPALDDQRPVKLGELVFHSEELDVAVVRLLDNPPKSAVPIDQVGPPRNTLEGVAVLHWTAAEGFAIGFGHGVLLQESTQPGLERGTTITQLPSGPESGQLYFTHVTGPGASGAPVFDTDTGDLVCLHQGGSRLPEPHPLAYCRSITTIIDAIRAQ